MWAQLLILCLFASAAEHGRGSGVLQDEARGDDCESGETCAEISAKPLKRIRLTTGNTFIQKGRTAVTKTVQESRHREASEMVHVVSYNLYWWNVLQNSNFDRLYDRIESNQPFDLIGFQECEHVESIVHAAGLEGFDFYQGPNKPDFNPAPLAWNAAAFQTLSGPSWLQIGEDKWGARIVTWVRLKHVATNVSVLFANTHGPVTDNASDRCLQDLGQRWVDAIQNTMVEGDTVLFTGDFNCWAGSAAMNEVRYFLAGGVEDHIDHIVSTSAAKTGGGLDGTPSDHPLVWGRFNLTNGGQDPWHRECGEIEEHFDYHGSDLSSVNGMESAEECSQACKENALCKSFTYAPAWQGCYLKRVVKPGRRSSTCCTSGLPACEDTYTEYAGYNCFPGQGARQVPGKTAFWACAEDCKKACTEEPECHGIVMSPRNQTSSKRKCWLRTDMHMENCSHGTSFDSWTKVHLEMHH